MVDETWVVRMELLLDINGSAFVAVCWLVCMSMNTLQTERLKIFRPNFVYAITTGHLFSGHRLKVKVKVRVSVVAVGKHLYRVLLLL